MVYVKRVELSNFKSFGGTTSIPFLPGFTVISGPNGSGKSNILDGILFCLSLASSKGMRAERLPDLINNNPEFKKTDICDFTEKFYFDILLDDKAGFEGEKDWKDIYNFLIEEYSTKKV